MTRTSNPETEYFLDAVERNIIATFSAFGDWDKGRLVDEDGALFFETPIAQAPYSSVMHTRWEDAAMAEAGIQHLLGHFEAEGKPVAWWVLPSSRPADLGERLSRHGLTIISNLTGMARQLDGLPEPPDLPPEVTIREVLGDADVETYVELQARRWHAEPYRDLLLEFHNWAGMGPDSKRHRWLAFLNDKPVAKAFTFIDGDIVDLYGVSTEPEARGRGLAKAVTLVGLQAAHRAGCRTAVLHSSEMAVSLYQGLGFQEVCHIPIYVTGD